MKNTKARTARYLHRHDNVTGILKSGYENIVNFFNRSDVKKFVKLTSSVTESINPFIEEPSIYNGTRAVFNVIHGLINESELYPDTYFSSDAWVVPYSTDFNSIIYDAVADKPKRTLKTSDDDVELRLFELDQGIEVGCSYNVKLSNVESMYIRIETFDEARSLIKDALWEFLGKNSIIMRVKREFGTHLPSGNGIEVNIDNEGSAFSSKQANEQVEYLRRCFAKGVNRSVLLYGPPGTGKSTMARNLVDQLGLRSFRICNVSGEVFSPKTLYDAVDLFKPDAIVMDDFDRVDPHAQGSYLEILEHFGKNVKLVLATVNDRDRLDEALLRPERFDELVPVERMDDDVIREILGEFSDGYDHVKDWPVVFIGEYVKRRKFMDHAAAERSMNELSNRVNRLKTYSPTWHTLNKKQDDDSGAAFPDSFDDSGSATFHQYKD